MPKRIQLSRKKGSKLPAGAVNVARPSRWGNPFRALDPRNTAHAVEEFRAWLFAGDRDAKGRHELKMAVDCLRGHDLACWCKPDQPCHADVLLELVNDPRAEPLTTVKVGDEVAIMGRRCRVDRLTETLGFPSFKYTEIGSAGWGTYHEGAGPVRSLAYLDLLDDKPATIPVPAVA